MLLGNIICFQQKVPQTAHFVYSRRLLHNLQLSLSLSLDSLSSFHSLAALHCKVPSWGKPDNELQFPLYSLHNKGTIRAPWNILASTSVWWQNRRLDLKCARRAALGGNNQHVTLSFHRSTRSWLFSNGSNDIRRNNNNNKTPKYLLGTLRKQITTTRITDHETCLLPPGWGDRG